MSSLKFTISTIFMLSLCGCSMFNPYIDRRRNPGTQNPALLYSGPSKPDAPVICYNGLWSNDEELQKLAVLECQKQKTGDNAEFLQKYGITNRKPGLTQFLGISEEEFQVEPYVRYFSPRNQEQYLMCSDGLTDMVAEDEIRKILSEKITVKEKVQNLLTLALDKGGRDNITMILCEVWEGIE